MTSSSRREFAEIGPQPHLHHTSVKSGPPALHCTGQLLDRYGLDRKRNGVRAYNE